MHFLYLTFFYSILSFLSGNPGRTNIVEPAASNIIYQSKDGGLTWQDISQGLPVNEQPEDFFAGGTDMYLRVKNVMYHSKSNFKTPVWEKETAPAPRNASIAFNRSGTTAYNYEGQICQRTTGTETWFPVYTNFKKSSLRSVFETSDGVIFAGCDGGLYKSSDKGENWKQVQNEGWVMDIVESEGVLVATGQKGIMRSTDKGEHWEWVISEGGVGIAIERIEGGFASISCNTMTMSRRIRISLDKGKTWKVIDQSLRPSLFISSIKQVGKYLICGHPDGIYRSSNLVETWNIVHASVDKKGADISKMLTNDPLRENTKVFKIYLSGNVLYAVAKDSGC
jgi:photosystem II stability/assembly factor-like uncharacterized protein